MNRRNPMIVGPMHCAEIAQRLGVSLDTFYKNRSRYSEQDGMPYPISRVGRPAYERSGIEAWLTRNDPRRPPAAANDAVPIPDAFSDDEHRARLAAAYAPQRPAYGLDSRRRSARG